MPSPDAKEQKIKAVVRLTSNISTGAAILKLFPKAWRDTVASDGKQIWQQMFIVYKRSCFPYIKQ